MRYIAKISWYPTTKDTDKVSDFAEDLTRSWNYNNIEVEVEEDGSFNISAEMLFDYFDEESYDSINAFVEEIFEKIHYDVFSWSYHYIKGLDTDFYYQP